MGKLIAFKDIPQETSQDDRFIMLRSGSHYVGVVRGVPLEQACHWNGKYYEYCSESSDCLHCKTCAPQMRYAFNFVEVDGSCMTPRLLELPKRAAAGLRQINEEYGPNVLISIERTGSGPESRYPATFKRKLERHEVEELESTPLFDLEEIYITKELMATEVK